MEFPKDELFEKLANIEHQRWADWQKYVHARLKTYKTKIDSHITYRHYISPTDYNQWERQINTPYSELSEREKDSDRMQVLRYWDLIVKEQREAYERAIKNYA